MPLRIDPTNLLGLERTIERCQVTSIPAGATPKFIKCKLPGGDGPIVDAWWSGFPSLAVSDYVALRRSAGGYSAQYVVTGTSAGTPASGGGMWPDDDQILLHGVNYTSVADAVTAAASSDIIYFGQQTITEAPSIAKFIVLHGIAFNLCILGKITTTAGASFHDIQCFTDAANEGIQISSVSSRCVDCKFTVSNGTDSKAIYNRVSGSTFYNCQTEAVSGSGNRYGIYVDNNGTASLYGGQFRGATADVFADTGASVSLYGPTLYNASSTVYPIAGGGTVEGYYFDLDGNLYFANGSGIINKVWLHDVSTGLIKRYTTLALALAAAATGDTVEFDGTITLTSNFDLNVAGVTLQGVNPETSILTTSTLTNTISLSGTGCALRNCAVTNTVDTLLRDCILVNGDNITIENVTATKTGAASTNIGIYHFDGDNLRVVNCLVTSSGATANYGYYNDTNAGTAEIVGGKFSGATYDIYGTVAGSTAILINPILSNSLISFSGTLNGIWKNSTGQNRYLYPYPNGFSGQATNYVITTSVATNDLTVALKNIAGNDPSITDRISARIGDTIYDITAALSVTALDATNWCNLGASTTAATDVDLFCYLISETGASAGVKIGFSRIPWARQMGDFTNTTTNDRYIKGNWTNFNTTDAVAVIGRFNATLSAAAGHVWTIPATSIIINRPIFETRWMTYTPAITSGTGTITTVGAVTATYQIVGRMLYCNHDITITTNGTGATTIIATTPVTMLSSPFVSVGREIVLTGNALIGFLNSTTQIAYTNYNATYPGGTGARLISGGLAIRLV